MATMADDGNESYGLLFYERKCTEYIFISQTKNLAVSINFIELVCYYCTFSIHYELFMFKTDSVTHCLQWMTVLTNLDRAFIVVGLIKEQGVGGGRK